MELRAPSHLEARPAFFGVPESVLVFFVWAIGGFALGALLFSYFGRGNYDEELFLYASNLVYHGKLPYRDFPYIFGPVLPFVYGVPQALFGPSLLAGRITSAFLSTITALSGSLIAYRFSRKLGVLVFLALILLNPLMLWVFTVTKTESLVTPLVMTSLAVWIARPRDRRALIVAASLLLWAVGVRQTVAPAFIVLTAVIFFQMRDSKRDMVLAGVVLVLQGLLLFGVLALLARGNMLFHLLETHLVYRETDYSIGERIDDIITFYPRELLQHFAVLLVPFAAILGVLAQRWRQGWRPSLKALDSDPLSAQVLLIVAAGLVFAPHLFLSLPFISYFVVTSTILAVAVASAVVTMEQFRSKRLAEFAPAAVLGAILLGGGLLFWSTYDSYVQAPDATVEVYADVNRYVRDNVGSDEWLIAFRPGFALTAGLPLPPEFTMGILSYSGVLSLAAGESYLTTEEAEERNMVDWVLLNDAIVDPRTRLVILDDGILEVFLLPGRAVEQGEGRPAQGEGLVQREIARALLRDLNLGRQDPQAVQLRYIGEFPGLSEGGYRLDLRFEEDFKDRLPGTHAFVR